MRRRSAPVSATGWREPGAAEDTRSAHHPKVSAGLRRWEVGVWNGSIFHLCVFTIESRMTLGYKNGSI